MMMNIMPPNFIHTVSVYNNVKMKYSDGSHLEANIEEVIKHGSKWIQQCDPSEYTKWYSFLTELNAFISIIKEINADRKQKSKESHVSLDDGRLNWSIF
jgi:hypothetical protein